MEKHKLNDEEIKKVDKFLFDLYDKHGDFGWAEIYKYEDDVKYEIYDIINHKAFVVSMYITAPTGADSETRKKIERFKYTERGHLSYQFGGYKQWEIYNEENIRFIRDSPTISQRSAINIEKSVNFSKAGIIAASIIGLMGVIISLVDLCQQRKSTSQIEQRLLKIESQLKTKHIQQNTKIPNIHTIVTPSPSTKVAATPPPPSHPN